MTRDDSLTVVGMIAAHWPGPQWNTDTLDAYAKAIEPLDAQLTTAAVVRAVNDLEFYPKVSVLREYVRIERILAEPEPPIERMPDHAQPASPPAWVNTWLVARTHNDFRVLPEQKPGYDTLQTNHPHYRTYVWPDRTPMPTEQTAVYAAESIGLSSADVISAITGKETQ